MLLPVSMESWTTIKNTLSLCGGDTSSCPGPYRMAACSRCHIGCWLDRQLFTLSHMIGKGIKLSLCFQKPVLHHSIKNYIKQILKIKCMRDVHQRSIDIHWNPLINTSSELKKNAESIFHLNTGHHILAKHLCPLEILQSLMCVL